jgi:glucose 1-dehydrogenase
MGTLDRKVVVITGSTRGLGLAMAQACADAGARVVVSSRSTGATAEAVAALGQQFGPDAVTGLACDVADMAQVQALAQHATATFGGFDVWINNAGYSPPYGPTAHVQSDAFMRVVQTNIVGVYNGSITAMRYFLPRRAGKLINILGRGDEGDVVPLQNGYASSKAWVRSFTRTLAKEYKDSGVGVYAFNPGMMSTDFLTKLEAVRGYTSRLRVMPTIIRMWATPPEIPAQRAVWLASSATDGRTGLEIHEMNRRQMLTGALREGLLRLLGKRPTTKMEIVEVPPALVENPAGRP